jgi:hypothetical protein
MWHCDGIASDVAAALQPLRWCVAYSTQPLLSTLVAHEAPRFMNLALKIMMACYHSKVCHHDIDIMNLIAALTAPHAHVCAGSAPPCGITASVQRTLLHTHLQQPSCKFLAYQHVQCADVRHVGCTFHMFEQQGFRKPGVVGVTRVPGVSRRCQTCYCALISP